MLFQTMEASVPSSNGNTRYVVSQHPNSSWSCTCPAWRNQAKHVHRRSCKHMVQLVKELGEHIVQALEEPAD